MEIQLNEIPDCDESDSTITDEINGQARVQVSPEQFLERQMFVEWLSAFCAKNAIGLVVADEMSTTNIKDNIVKLLPDCDALFLCEVANDLNLSDADIDALFNLLQKISIPVFFSHRQLTGYPIDVKTWSEDTYRSVEDIDNLISDATILSNADISQEFRDRVPKAHLRFLHCFYCLVSNISPDKYEFTERPLPFHLGGYDNNVASDRHVLPFIVNKFGIRSAVDIGCGMGGMVQTLLDLGLNAQGIDGDWTILDDPGCPCPDSIVIHDFYDGVYETDEAFDLGIAIEFVDRIEEEHIIKYMSLFHKCKYALITHAMPDQEDYVNVQAEEYWIELFENHGFKFDRRTSVTIRQYALDHNPHIARSALFFIHNMGIPESEGTPAAIEMEIDQCDDETPADTTQKSRPIL